MQKQIEDKLIRFGNAIKAIGGEFDDFIIAAPATQKEIDQIESSLGFPLPADLKEFASKVSRKIYFNWYLPDNFELPDSLSEIFSGGLDFDISKIPEHESVRAGWQSECFPNPKDPYDITWHNKLGFHHVPNGDYLGVDSGGKIIYLSHDDGEGHGYTMASSFSDLIRNWLPLGCPGPEDWQWLPFVSNSDSGIQLASESANEWLNLLNQKS